MLWCTSSVKSVTDQMLYCGVFFGGEKSGLYGNVVVEMAPHVLLLAAGSGAGWLTSASKLIPFHDIVFTTYHLTGPN